MGIGFSPILLIKPEIYEGYAWISTVKSLIGRRIFVFNGVVSADTTHVEAEASAPKKNDEGIYMPNPHDDNVGVLRKSPTVTNRKRLLLPRGESYTSSFPNWPLNWHNN
jgi:hypothetical protein